jgi:hypothetical protein
MTPTAMATTKTPEVEVGRDAAGVSVESVRVSAGDADLIGSLSLPAITRKHAELPAAVVTGC